MKASAKRAFNTGDATDLVLWLIVRDQIYPMSDYKEAPGNWLSWGLLRGP